MLYNIFVQHILNFAIKYPTNMPQQAQKLNIQLPEYKPLTHQKDQQQPSILKINLTKSSPI